MSKPSIRSEAFHGPLDLFPASVVCKYDHIPDMNEKYSGPTCYYIGWLLQLLGVVAKRTVKLGSLICAVVQTGYGMLAGPCLAYTILLR